MHLNSRRHLNPAGNVLIYVVVLMLIFGVLGVVMVSLFTSTTASTVTRNDSRRARYTAESGMRYAFSEMRKADFDLNHMIDTLNTITYKISNTENFTINVFSPWFESSANQSISSSPPDLALSVPIGAVPLNYTIPVQPASPNNIYAVNYEFVGLNPTAGGVAEITGYAYPAPPPAPNTLTLALKDDFNANLDERIAFAVKPVAGQDVDQPGVDLDLPLEAQYFLPKYGGAVSIRRNDYFYEQRKEEPAGAPTKVVLTNLSKATQSKWLTTPPQTQANDWVVMSPRNYLVVPTGTSDGTIYGGDYLFGKGIYDASLIRPGSAPPDITADDLTSNLSEQESTATFFSVDQNLDELYIGGGGSDRFGSAFFDADMSIGGDENYCVGGACLFELGVRAFFLLEVTGQGDGITFTLTNAATNNETSVGGDFELSELMGYAGDSRTNAAGTTFVATDSDDRGLDPPKFAVEFDTRTNDTTYKYCADASTVNTDTRNDPLASNKDAVQYVFWGRTSFLNIPCRDDNTLYDDNRHDADGEEATEEWRFGTSGLVGSSPAIGSDGTVYVVSDGKLYAINPDGSLKWDSGTNLGLSPVVGPDHTIYAVGNSNGFLYAFKTNGDPKGLPWPFNAQGDLDGSPTYDDNGTPADITDDTIYAGRDWNSAGDPGQVIAVKPDGTAKGLNWPFVVPTAVENDIDARPAVGSDGTVYAGSEDGFFYAINPDGTPKGLNWPFNTRYVTTAAAIGADGTIYVGSHNDNVYAINPDGTPKGLSWPFTAPSGNIMTSPAIDPNNGTIYVGSDDGHLYAINPNGTEKWRFPDSGSILAVQSSPLIDLDGTIYFGSNDAIVFAVNPDGTEKWQFLTGGPVKSSPAIGKAGFIHFGSDDTNVYAINQFANPRNFKDEDKSLGKLLTVEDLSSTTEIVQVDDTDDWLNGKPSVRGPYAVRLEVDRCPSEILNAFGECEPNAEGEFDYELRLWIRQCNNDVDCDNILGTFFQDTRIEYGYSAVPATLPMIQRFSLSALDQAKFDRFYFGFTGAAGAEALNVAISQFNLSFIRPGDPFVTDDSTSWPP